jgi:hypothetical protein
MDTENEKSLFNAYVVAWTSATKTVLFQGKKMKWPRMLKFREKNFRNLAVTEATVKNHFNSIYLENVKMVHFCLTQLTDNTPM